MKYKLLLFSLLFIFLVGCGGPMPVIIDTTVQGRVGKIPTEVKPIKQDMGERGIQFIIEDNNKGFLRLARVTESLTPTNYLKLDLTFQNVYEKPVNGEYLVQFFDENGVPIEEPIGWKPVAIPPKTTTYENVTAPNELCYYYKITVKTKPIQDSY